MPRSISWPKNSYDALYRVVLNDEEQSALA
ncbi:hypothetical protein QFZ55_007290 [Streptomyces luteogriseus]|nr:hypothetical protein [Streptomyces luteogriseus]